MTRTKLAEQIAAAAHDCDDVDCPCDPMDTIYATASTGGVITLVEGPPEIIAAVVQGEIDQRDAEIKRLKAELDEAEHRRDKFHAALKVANGNTERRDTKLKAAEAERDRLDVRLDEISAGFVKANRLHPVSEDGNLCATCRWPYPCPTVTALSSIGDHASEVIAERDQLKAANDRAKTLATNADRTECGAGWTLDPAEVLAALGRSDLPAIRDLVANLDPREEST